LRHRFHGNKREVLGIGAKSAPASGQTKLDGFAIGTQHGFGNRIAALHRGRF
jgi:hypothetical protein